MEPMERVKRDVKKEEWSSWLTPRSWWWWTWRGLVVQHVLALRNVTLRCRLVELPATMRTLNVVAGVADRWWWKVTQSSTCRQMCLNLLRRANRIYELFVLTSPIRLHLWLLRFQLQTITQSIRIFRHRKMTDLNTRFFYKGKDQKCSLGPNRS